MTAHAAPALGLAPERAIRDRVVACALDGVAVSFLIRLIVPAIGIHDFGGAAFASLVIYFLYFFLQEAAGGQTLAKRVRGLRVVQLDGTPPKLQQVAVRNALRVFDTLPMFYASGLVAVMWSGPGRRQRMGDRVAETAVILEPGRAGREPGDKLLPGLTITAVLLSVIFYGVLYDEYRTPNFDANAMLPPVVQGFSGDNSQPPSPGPFTAQAYVNGTPVVDAQTREPLLRHWTIEKRCSGSACRYHVTRDVPGSSDESGDMTPAADGWHAVFPTQGFKTLCPGVSSPTSAARRAAFVIHFEPRGERAEAHEVNAFHSRRCGDLTRQLDWQIERAHF